MTKLEIQSKKRPVKAIVAIFLILLLGSGMLYFDLVGEVINRFVWWKLVILILISILLMVFTIQLIQFIFYKNVTAVVERTGEHVIAFYSLTNSGRKLTSSQHHLFNIKRIYIKKSTQLKGLIVDYSLQYKLVKPDPFPTQDIKILPDLFAASEKDMERMLAFVKQQRDEIEIGYEGIWKF